MKTEYEAKFLDIDVDNIRSKLKESGAILEKPMRLMRRVVIETPDLRKKNAYIRIRDEGDRVTVTYKQFDELSIDGAKEHEIEVDSFDEAIALFKSIGLLYNSFQESKRETWKLEGAEVVIDEWPWLKPYIEVEGNTENHVEEVAIKLGFRWGEAVFGDVMAAYRAEYPHLATNDTVGNIPLVKFDDPLPDLLKDVS